MFEVNLRTNHDFALRNLTAIDQKVDFICDYIYRVDRNEIEKWIKVIYYNEDAPNVVLDEYNTATQQAIPDSFMLSQGVRARRIVDDALKHLANEIKKTIPEFEDDVD